jgi:hypothetical protein
MDPKRLPPSPSLMRLPPATPPGSRDESERAKRGGLSQFDLSPIFSPSHTFLPHADAGFLTLPCGLLDRESPRRHNRRILRTSRCPIRVGLGVWQRDCCSFMVHGACFPSQTTILGTLRAPMSSPGQARPRRFLLSFPSLSMHLLTAGQPKWGRQRSSPSLVSPQGLRHPPS